jgi:TRAP-type mannitol/chloroaromatic compound transport system permease large subunit
VQRTFNVMSNDVLISAPLFIVMGYVPVTAGGDVGLLSEGHLAT